MRNYDDSQSPLIRSLRAAEQSPQNGRTTPAASWQALRHAGSADELAAKARSYIQGLLRQDRGGLR